MKKRKRQGARGYGGGFYGAGFAPGMWGGYRGDDADLTMTHMAHLGEQFEGYDGDGDGDGDGGGGGDGDGGGE